MNFDPISFESVEVDLQKLGWFFADSCGDCGKGCGGGGSCGNCNVSGCGGSEPNTSFSDI